MGFHGIERYTTIPEIRYGIVNGKGLSTNVYVPKRNEYRPLHPIYSRYRVDKPYYDKFESDVKSNGFRNPALCWCFDDNTYAVYGTTRVWIAHKLNIDVPTFIVDWSENWKHLELIESRKQALDKFIDPPIELVFEPDFFSFYNERNSYDPYQIKRRLQESKRGEA
mgnify:CR=1 FL=1|jgi:hypothetical protein